MIMFRKGFPGGSAVKDLPAMQETQEMWIRSLGQKGGHGTYCSITPGGGHGTHSSILAWRIPMDRGAWWGIVYRVTKSWT